MRISHSVALLLVALWFFLFNAGKVSGQASLQFTDNMDGYNSSLWHKDDRSTNGVPFWNGWRADHVDFLSGKIRLRLDDLPCRDTLQECSWRPYASGEYATNALYSYGRVEASLKAAKGSGVVTALFAYTGPSDGKPHDEIDVEILGKNTLVMQINYCVNGKCGNERNISLGFDASLDYHTYGFEWSQTGIKWLVDGKVVWPKEEMSGLSPNNPMRIMVSLWCVDDTGSIWAGPFIYSGVPIYAYYDWISYKPLDYIPSPRGFQILNP